MYVIGIFIYAASLIVDMLIHKSYLLNYSKWLLKISTKNRL